MAQSKIGLKPEPVGTKLVRLRDLPLEVRMRAALECAREAKDRHERYRLFAIARDPEDLGGRIAA